MIQHSPILKKETKQRLTAFVDPVLVTRAKVRGALEGLTISEVVEKALDVYAPKIEQDVHQQIYLKFINGTEIDVPSSETDGKAAKTVLKHTKNLVVPR